MRKREPLLTLLVAHLTAALASSVKPAYGQERPALEEIVVTATRTETSLQETPMSIKAFSGDELDMAGIDAGRDLGIMVPNVVLAPGPTGSERESMMTIRGLPGVTTYVDGVWLGNWGFLQRSFVELERVEVLRGPQGTLFGRNTNGGAIQLVTRRPGDTLGARVDARIGEFDRRAVTLAVDWPIAEGLKTRWTAAADRNDGFLESRTAPLMLGDEDDSFYRFDMLWEPVGDFSLRLVANEENSYGSDPRIVRVSNPSEVGYIAYNVLAGNPDYLGQARAINPAFPAPPAPLTGDRFTRETHEPGFPGGVLGKWQTMSDLPGPTAVFDSRYATLTLNWTITPQLALESLTSHGDADSRQGTDYDASEFTFRTRFLLDRVSATTQELHLTGNHFGGRLQSLLGLYYQEYESQRRTYAWEDWEFAIPNTGPNPGTPGLPGAGGRPLWNTTAVNYVRAWGATVGNNAIASFAPRTYLTRDGLDESRDTDRAFFGHVTIGLRDKLDLGLGFRYTADDGRFATYVPAEAFRPLEPGAIAPGDLYAAAAVVAVEEEPDFGTAATPRASISYRPTSEIYLYASYAEGFTSSEVVPNQASPAEPITLDPEVVQTREFGLRSDWLDKRLRFNATFFDSRWEGVRVSRLLDDPNNPGQPSGLRVPDSSGVAESAGFELELTYLPAERWQLDFAIGRINTEYVDIGNPPANGTGLQLGTPFQYAPEASFAVSVRHHLPLPTGEILFAGDYGWMDEYERAPASDVQRKNPDGTNRLEPAYGVLNARIDYRPSKGNWWLSLFGTNLTNEWYVSGGGDIGLYEGYDFATIGRPREVGVGLQFVF
jgi:iron complex outermembrane receptor protein